MKTGLDIILEVGVGLGAFAVLFTAIGIMEFFRDRQGSIVDCLLIMLPGLTCGASLVSAAWTIFACAHLRVVIKGRRFMAQETVLLPTSRMQELFSVFI